MAVGILLDGNQVTNGTEEFNFEHKQPKLIVDPVDFLLLSTSRKNAESRVER